ncbi:MAG: ABC transporter substrate-binding protein [Acidovorax sp.]
MKTLKTLAISALLLAGTAHLAVSAEGPVRISATFELSGAAADVSRDALEGTKYGVEHVNQNGGVLGRQIALTYQDNGTNAQKAINQANSMIKDGANNLLITASSSSSVAVNKTVTAREKVLTCASTSQTDDLTIKDFNPYIFAVSPNSYMVMRSIATYLAKQPYKRYAVLAADYTGGRIGANRFKEFLKQFNPQAEIVVEEYPKFGASDFTPPINKILAAKPDYVFSMLFGNDLLTFSKQAGAVGFFQQINHRISGLYDGLTLKAMGSNAPIGTDGYQAAAMNGIAASSPEGKKFVETYKAKHGHYPSDWSVVGFECVSVWAQAANSAKSLEPGKVMAAIESQTFKSPRGDFKFGKFDHQAEVPVYIGKVAQSTEYGQAVVEMKEIVPGKDSRPSEQAVMKMRKGD